MKRGIRVAFFFFLLSLLFFIPSVRTFTYNVFIKSFYVPVLKVEATLVEFIEVRRERDRLVGRNLVLEAALGHEVQEKLSEHWSSEIEYGVIARALTFDPLGIPAEIVLDKGTLDGLEYGDPILAYGDLAGRIMAVRSENSVAITLHNSLFRSGVMDKRSGVLGVIAGGPRVSLGYVPLWADVRPGDTLVTSGLGGLILPGLPVGTVASVDTSRTSPHFLTISVMPFYDHSKTCVFMVPER
jgi:rod shape-determining protein MreC